MNLNTSFLLTTCMLRSWSCRSIDRDSGEFGQQAASLVSPKVLTGRARLSWPRLR